MENTTSQLAWVEDDTDKIKASISTDVAVEVRELADEMDSSMTQSLILGAAVQDKAHDDELARVEDYLDKRLEAEGVPPSLLETAENKKSVSEWQDDDKYRFRAQLPMAIVDMIGDNAPSERRKGWWATNALIAYLESPYESRFTRVETKRQVLTLLDGGDVSDEEMTSVMSGIRAGYQFQNVHDVLFGEGGRRVIQDVSSVDWRSASRDELVLEKNQDLSKLAKTKDVRTEAIKAWVRGRDTSVSYSAVDTMVDEMNPDYSTESTLYDIKESVWDFANESDDVDVPDAERDELVERLQMKCRRANRRPNEILRKDISDATVPELLRSVERL